MAKTRKDCIIVGAGPAGLSAAIYAGRAGVDTQVLGCAPKIAGDYDIDNYFGFEETITGKDLMERGTRQARRFGVDMSCEKVLSVHYGEEGDFVVTTDQGEYQTCSLILATGVSRVRPGIANLDEYDGKGVSYCVSCDGFFYRNKKVLVLGEGIFAANQALELTQYTNDVAICSQGKNLTITDEFLDRIKDATEKGAEIEIIEKKIETLEGDNGLERVVFTDGEKRDADGLFIAMGEASSTDFAYSLGLVTEGQFIKVDYDMKTNIPGIFAAGDCVGGFLQIAVAVGEGAKAGRAAISHIRKVCHKKQKEKAAAAG